MLAVFVHNWYFCLYIGSSTLSLPPIFLARPQIRLCQFSLAECNIQNIKQEVVHILVTVALEESASRRELASVLISDLYGSIINSRDVAEGKHTLVLQVHLQYMYMYPWNSSLMLFDNMCTHKGHGSETQRLSNGFLTLWCVCTCTYSCARSCACMYGCVGFNLLLEELSELSLDTPDAAEVLGNFMARAVADDCIPPAYIANVAEMAETQALYVVKNTVGISPKLK